MYKIKKSDKVVVLAGKDRGKQGIVIGRTGPNHAIVEGINTVKKSVKPNPMAGTAGGITSKPMPIHVSNIALFNAKTGKADRISFENVEGKKVRIFKSNGEIVKV